MQQIKFVVFHTGVETLPSYLPLMRVSKEALQVTNPGAQYVVLTDRETAPALDKEFEVEVLAPSGAPLMCQYVIAQMKFEAKSEDGLNVLAATDCVARKDLSTSLNHDMAITYRIRGKHKINNIAYVRDHDLAAWFLARALKVMRPEDFECWGDQASWQEALGPFETWQLLEPKGPIDGIRSVRLGKGKVIYLYPCRTHNYFNKHSGAGGCTNEKAFLVHFKGSRKRNMVDSVNWYILGRRVPDTGEKPDWKQRKAEGKAPFPMQERALRCKSR